MTAAIRLTAVLGALGIIAGCGGGGGGGGDDGGGLPIGGGNNGWSQGVFLPSSTYANQCAAPRSGTNPQTSAPYPDIQGSATTEKMFLRSWTNELYLWYDEVPDVNPAPYSVLEYFDLLKTTELTASNRPKDNFHFTYDSQDWYELSQAGVQAGYGMQVALLAVLPPRQAVIAFIEPNSPAAEAGLTRGVEIIEVDGVDLAFDDTQAGVDTLNAGLFPAEPGEDHTFLVRQIDGTERVVTLTSEEITSSPVLRVSTIDTDSGSVGYILFNDHIAPAESALVDAIEQLRDAQVQDLVLDIRYNGGGYLDIASELAYMIAGDAQTAGQTFERLVFNDKHPTTDPVTGRPLTPTPFHNETQDFSLPPGQGLPTLDLSRVYVLTGPDTCSASEAIINGLRGVDVEVLQVGSTTCGKPYGFYPRDNCGTTYFSIQFKGENAKGFGDYADGFTPANSNVGGEEVPGCQVADDFDRELGDPIEGRLAAALGLRASNNQTCPAPSFVAPDRQLKAGASPREAPLMPYKSPFRQNRILRAM